MPYATSGVSLSIPLALLAALFWGGGDFSGGMGSKAAGGTTNGTLRVVISGQVISLAALSLLLSLRGHLSLAGAPVAWGLGCGAIAGLSIVAFYLALARGAMGASAALSGLLAAAIPAALGALLEGWPGWLHLLGFGVAALAIWYIAAPEHTSATDTQQVSRSTTWLAIAGGVGFGLYFAGLKFANPLGILEPLALARLGGVLTSLVLLACLRRRAASSDTPGPWLTRSGWYWATSMAVLDTAGNLLYIAATRVGRLDVAAVLASLYPASTILLAAGILRETPRPRQFIGMGIAAVAIVMVTI